MKHIKHLFLFLFFFSFLVFSFNFITASEYGYDSVRLSGSSGSGSSTNIIINVSANHNDLQNIQGGSPTERYHLLLASYNNISYLVNWSAIIGSPNPFNQVLNTSSNVTFARINTTSLKVKDATTTIVTISSGVGNENATIDFKETDVPRARIEYSGLDSILRIWSMYADGIDDVLMSFNVITNEVIVPKNLAVIGNLTASNICYSNGTGCAASTNPFNQVLNTTSNIRFNNVNVTGELIVNKSIRWLESTGIQNLFYINPLDSDGFRMEYWYNFELANDDWLVFHKTDGNDASPDGGIAFMMSNASGYNKTIIKFDGYGNANFTDQNVTTTGNIQAPNICYSNGSNCNDTDITSYAQYNFSNNNFNGSGNFVTTGNITARNICYSNGSNCNTTISTISGSGTNGTIPMWTFNNTLGDSPIVREMTDEDFMTIYNGTFYIDETNNVVGVNIVPGAESHAQALQVNTYKKTGIGNLTTNGYNSILNTTLVISNTTLPEDMTDATNLIIGSTHYYIRRMINETAFDIQGNYTFSTTSWSYKQAPYIDVNAETNNAERGYSISTNGSWKWAWSIPIGSNDTELCFQQSDLYYEGTADAFCLDTSSGKSLLTNNGPASFVNNVYVGSSGSSHTAINSTTTKAGMFLPTKYVGVDSTAGGDSGFVFAYENQPMWDWSTFVAEQGKFLHLINYQAGQDALTVAQTGRIGVNKPSNVMSYHSGFTGTGLNDMSVGGTYTGSFNDFIEVNATSTNQFSFRVTIHNGAVTTVGSWSTPAAMSTSPITIYKGITIQWASATGHTIGDMWFFNAFAANPTGTFTVKPTVYQEVLYYNGSNYFDYTFIAGTSTSTTSFSIFNNTGQYLYVGRFIPTVSTQFGIATPATGLSLKAEYWNGATWTTINSTNTFYDGTDNLTKTGGVTWDGTTVTDWQTNVSVDDYNSTTGYYWIRYSTTSAGTSPILNTITPQAFDRLAIYQSGFDTEPIFSVAPNGDTKITGTLLANGFYGELWDATSRTLTLTTQSVWYNFTLWNNTGSEISGWTLGTGIYNYTLVNVQPGLYTVTYILSTSLNFNENAQFGIMVNGVVEPKSTAQKRFTSGQTDVISQTFLRRFIAGDRLWLIAQDLDSSGRVLTTLNKNLVVTRIGN